MCKKKVENDNVQGLKYKTKSYCIDCFYENVKPNEVDKHFMYLKFQSITGRVPSSAEWTQCERLIKDHKWDWQKIELMLEYVYLIEEVEISDDYGVIGILPFYENQARIAGILTGNRSQKVYTKDHSQLPQQPQSLCSVSRRRGRCVRYGGLNTCRCQAVLCLYGQTWKERSVCKRPAENCQVLHPVLL